jgi:hypothetical protein
MPLPNSPWSTNYPTSQDNLGVKQPDQVEDSYPGAQDGNRLLISHLHTLRDKLDAVANKVGDNSDLPAGCHGARITALEGAGGGGQTDTVAGANGITNTGDNVDAVLEPTYGSTANTVCQGNDSRLSDARTPTAHAASHQFGGGDAIKLDDLDAPEDNTDLNATISAHGLLPKLGGGTTNFLRADGTWATPGGSSPLTTKGDLHGFDTGDARIPVGANGTVLTADSTVALGVKWAAPAGGGATPHEEEFATTGAETPGATVTFGPLNATPRGGGTADTPTGYEILVFRNGVKMKYNATPSTYDHYFYDSVNNEIDVLASGSADDYEVVYGS